MRRFFWLLTALLATSCIETPERGKCRLASNPSNIGSGLYAGMTMQADDPGCAVSFSPASGLPRVVRQPEHGRLRLLGQPYSGVVYVPERGYVGSDRFSLLTASIGTVNIDVDILPSSITKAARP